jgi:hypothetical protein
MEPGPPGRYNGEDVHLMIRVAGIVLAVGTAGARGGETLCNIPVFRYALERWNSATYEVVVFHQGPLDGDARVAVDALRAGGANVEVDHSDLGRDPSPRLKKIWEAEPGAAAPWMVALFPGMDKAAWSGPASGAGVAALLDSPARRELSRRLLAGDSAVWILLESGDPVRDEAASTLLDQRLRNLETSLKIPPRTPEDPPLLSDVPMKIAFSTLRLSRKDPAEKTFVEMLRRSQPQVEGPAVFGVFGRGRALPPILASDLNGPTFDLTGEFVAGPCACEVKELNPGLDLLLSVDWDQALSLARSGAELPVPEPVIAPGAPSVAPAPAPPSVAPAAGRAPRPILWGALGLALILVLITGTRALRRA